ncbi:Ig domain-containing protein [Legionella maceachernii]|uniref:Uncharacterized protein n=1 Tax=Legionella maceachernii TaxID=466 RepID=A0A0W0W3J8_9GAMM|nr:Ig domain-containing protein [Legionella maceachernii]KTD27028.1 hypothetical protein Lmac_1276 [Legionella maceachernii]SKA03541.1 hypothetical protein SAMN02745128_01834 [Legionella maceachernii]SUP00187.1 Uncharacterised protein [Legionella maceachernii]
MKRVSFLLLLSSLPVWAMASPYPSVVFQNLTPFENTVYFGEQKVIKIKMHYEFLKYAQEWYFPLGVGLLINAGVCPYFISGFINFPYVGDCYFSLIISGNQLGQTITGNNMFRLSGGEDGVYWDIGSSIPFAITVIPHSLSMTAIPIQKGTANVPFILNLKPYVNYYGENVQAGVPPQGNVIPASQDGLFFDSSNFAIFGKPTRTGTYVFSIGAANAYSSAAPAHLIINVGINPEDTPIFKAQNAIPSASPGQNFQLNLIELIESKSQPSNPIRFRIDQNEPHPHWLTVGGVDNNYLVGIPQSADAGSDDEVTLIASTNTGGDSWPLKIRIPVATDPNSKPTIKAFSLKKSVGDEFSYDVRKQIVDPTNDRNLQLVIERIEPEVTWLQVSPNEPTILMGSVPMDVTGQKYQLSLHVNTRIGGDSESVKVSLSIATDNEKKPRFKEANPQLPTVYPGQPFYHDFVLNHDIFPEYEAIPYAVEFAKDHEKPSWLRIEDNKLIADLVPEMEQQFLRIYLTIKNIPGGKSEIIPLSLFVMN